MTKVYKRVEDGTTTYVSIRVAIAEVTDAQMGRVDRDRRVRTMSSGRTQHHIVYADGRDVRMDLVDEPATVEPEQGPTAWTGEVTRIVTVQGRRYVVGTIVPAGDRGSYRVVNPYVSYWTERNGETFGATRHAAESCKAGTVGRAIWDAVNAEEAAQVDEPREWHGTRSNLLGLHRFNAEGRARCNPRYRANALPDAGTGALRRTRAEVEAVEYGEIYTFCTRCAALPDANDLHVKS